MKASPLSFTFSCKFFIQLVVTVQFSSVTQLCPTLCDPMDCSTPGFPVLHVLWVSDAIQPSHPLSPTSPLAFNLSKHQGLFQWASSSHQMAKVLELQLQHQFKSINSSAFSLLYGPAVTSIHDYCENHSFDYTDFVGKMMSLLFIRSLGLL